MQPINGDAVMTRKFEVVDAAVIESIFSVEADALNIVWSDWPEGPTARKIKLVIKLDSSFSPSLFDDPQWKNINCDSVINYNTLNFNDLIGSLKDRVYEVLDREGGEIGSCDVRFEAFDPMTIFASAARVFEKKIDALVNDHIKTDNVVEVTNLFPTHVRQEPTRSHLALSPEFIKFFETNGIALDIRTYWPDEIISNGGPALDFLQARYIAIFKNKSEADLFKMHWM
jgi:hypothetical protein